MNRYDRDHIDKINIMNNKKVSKNAALIAFNDMKRYDN
jgi:hypothetical protein